MPIALIVATTPIELQRLGDLRERCVANEIATFDVGGTDLKTLEPRIAGLAALLVPGTGIVDYRRVSRALAEAICRFSACTSPA